MAGSFVPKMSFPEERASQTNSYLPQIPVTVETLPSRSLAYPPEAKIRYRPYTFGEVKQASQIKNMPEEDRFDFVLQGIETNFDPESLTVSDLLYLGVLRKISTFGSTKASLIVQCGCGRKIQHAFDTQTLEFKDLSAPDLPLFVDLSTGKTLEFMPLTVAGFKILVREKKTEDEIAWFAAQVVGIPFEEAYEAIYNASPLDREILEEVDQVLYHGLAPILVVCDTCEKKHLIEPDGEGALIVPFRLDEGTPRTRIRYGSRTAHKSNSSKPDGLRRS